jgi:LAO/AO transport system kinase
MSNEGLRIISVTGASSNVGKTTLCSILLRGLKGFGAVKFTRTSLYTSVVDDVEILGQQGKDTAMFLEAGAEKVVWVKSPTEGLGNALDIALSKVSGCKGVIIEGNSPVDFLNPHLVIFIMGHKGDIKPSALKARKKADILIINSEEQIKGSAFLVPEIREKAEVFSLNLKKSTGEIDELLSCVRRKFYRDSP